MPNANSGGVRRPVVEILEGRTLLSISPSLGGRHTFPTHTVLTVESGALGQPITFDVTVYAAAEPIVPVDLYYRGKLFQELHPVGITSRDPRFFWATEATYTVPVGTAGARMFGVGPHAVRARSLGAGFIEEALFFPSTTVAVFRVKRAQFIMQPTGVGIATVDAGSGPALQPGQTATVQYNAYLAATYRLFYSTESQTPNTQSFTVDADPEQVIPGLDAGVVGMQAGETRAIYIPRSLSRGCPGSLPVRQPRANLVYLVTLVSID